MKTFIVLISLLISVLSFNCTDSKKNKVLTKEITFTKEGELNLEKQLTDSLLVVLDIEIADDDYQIQTGLMYRHSMKNNQGMLFIFKDENTRSFYMKNTEFPLDIIFINSNKEVVSIQENTKPYDNTSLPSEAPALYVLEVNAGLSEKWTLEKGDVLDWKAF